MPQSNQAAASVGYNAPVRRNTTNTHSSPCDVGGPHRPLLSQVVCAVGCCAALQVRQFRDWPPEPAATKESLHRMQGRCGTGGCFGHATFQNCSISRIPNSLCACPYTSEMQRLLIHDSRSAEKRCGSFFGRFIRR